MLAPFFLAPALNVVKYQVSTMFLVKQGTDPESVPGSVPGSVPDENLSRMLKNFHHLAKFCSSSDRPDCAGYPENAVISMYFAPGFYPAKIADFGSIFAYFK